MTRDEFEAVVWRALTRPDEHTLKTRADTILSAADEYAADQAARAVAGPFPASQGESVKLCALPTLLGGWANPCTRPAGHDGPHMVR
jgi:hypothetical protein